jgi:RTX calcium-binding nonapeptide repeat (4 copies)
MAEHRSGEHLDSGIDGRRLRRAGLTAAVALAAIAAFPSLASAVTVSLASGMITYQAVPGETNSVTVTEPGTNYQFAETGIVAGAGCTQGVNLVTCPEAGTTSVVMHMDDMGDTVNATAVNQNPFTVNGGAGGDTLTLSDLPAGDIGNGDAGNDTINGEPGVDTLNGGDDVDIINGGDGNDTLNGGSGGDTLNGDNELDTLNGNDGADTLNGGQNNDTLNGGADDDILDGGIHDDTLNGGDGADSLEGNANNDLLNGDDGPDFLSGGLNNDNLNGATELSAGDASTDRMNGGFGNDDFDGGNGIDRVLYYIGCGEGGATLSITITIDNVANDAGCHTETGDNVRTSVESVTGSAGNDFITGSCFANTFSGAQNVAEGTGSGNDTLTGDPAGCLAATTDGTEADFFGGGEGNDIFNGDGTGNAGFDTVTYGVPFTGYTSGINVTFDDAANDSDGFGNAADNVNGDIERLIGSPMGDTIDATAADQDVQLFGRLGDDLLTDGPFNDLLNGEGGADTVSCPNGGTNVSLNNEVGAC